jgi:tetratricopeptide repeat protein 21B
VRAYTSLLCCRDLATSDPSAWTYTLLGEAYMSVQMPDAAIDAFERALQMDPGKAHIFKHLNLLSV